MMVGKNTGSTETAKRIPIDSIGVEIGVWRGDTTDKFIKNAKKIIAVDPWSVEGNEDPNLLFKKYKDIVGAKTIDDFEEYYLNVYEFVKKRFQHQKGISIQRMPSSEWYKINKKTDFDWVYIDGLHNHDGCYHDLIECWKIIRPAGIMFGDDYPNKSGVVTAVNQFVRENKLVLNRFSHNQWYIDKT